MLNRSKSVNLLRVVAILAFIIAILFGSSAPALAISYGEPDGDGHPFVGSMVARLPDGRLLQWCSGTLIAENVFLTASHCTAPVDQFLASRPGAELLVTFDPTISESGTFYTGTWYTNPKYSNFQGKYGRSDPGDIAVIVLDQAPGITPARLPTAGFLDELKKSHSLATTRFTTVGYGDIRETNRTGFQGILNNLDRNRVDQGFLSLTPAWLNLSMNLATGNGGTCYGDSGGPNYLEYNGVLYQAGITSWGDSPCASTNVTYRVDIPATQDFLQWVVDGLE